MKRTVHGLIYTIKKPNGEIKEDLYWTECQNPAGWKLEDVPSFMWNGIFRMDFMFSVRVGEFDELGKPLSIVGVKWGEEEARFSEPYLLDRDEEKNFMDWVEEAVSK